MSSDSEKHVEELLDRVSTHGKKSKGKYVDEVTAATSHLLHWLSYLRSSLSRKVADRLLEGAQASIIETAGCLSLGLVRPALFSIRTQQELVLSWIYFNDHEVEWRYAERTLSDYPMRGAHVKYMGNYDNRFKDRFALLSKKRTRKEEDPYGILSVHVHSLTQFSAPAVVPLKEMVRPESQCDECVRMQFEVAEYLTDTLTSWFATCWQDFPANIKDGLSARLSPSELKTFLG